ncbi:MAG TPA: YigZ family protein [Atribacterota bacterium]|nr:YigZ family protein [Atribacterota bacterium]
MEYMNYFQTVARSAKFENIIKKSRFIALVQGIETEPEVRSFLKEAAQKYPDAAHHCWAYRLDSGKNKISQYSDGGEPANSAGPPILQAIKQEQLTNVIVLVIRYFGGIKLGKSGLIKAYRDTARSGLQQAGKKRSYPWQEFIIEGIEYQSLGTILQSIESKSGKIDDILYGDRVKISALLPEIELEWLQQLINNVTQGKAGLKIGAIRWIDG